MTIPTATQDVPDGARNEGGKDKARMLNPRAALRLLCHRTGGTISRTTFYRWLSSGKIPSIRLGARIFVPRLAIESMIEECFAID